MNLSGLKAGSLPSVIPEGDDHRHSRHLWPSYGCHPPDPPATVGLGTVLIWDFFCSLDKHGLLLPFSAVCIRCLAACCTQQGCAFPAAFCLHVCRHMSMVWPISRCQTQALAMFAVPLAAVLLRAYRTATRRTWRTLLRSRAVRYIGSEAALQRHAGELRALSDCVVGFDCEWRPGAASPTALVQLATVDVCYLVHLVHFDGLPPCLAHLLQDERCIKVGVGVAHDAQRLTRDFGIAVRGCVELMGVARAVDPQLSGGLKALAERLLHVPLSIKRSSVAASDWAQPALTRPQRDYAAMDAICGYEVAGALHRLSNAPGGLPQWVGRFADAVVLGAGKPGRGGKPPGGTGAAGKAAAAHSHRAFMKGQWYHQIIIVGADGTKLSTCDDKKAQWYLKKGLAVKVSPRLTHGGGGAGPVLVCNPPPPPQPPPPPPPHPQSFER